jgi:hypothetical protein
MGRWVLSALLGLMAVPNLGRGDICEWRIGAGVGLTVMDARAGGASGTGVGYAARGRLAYGLLNTLEVGLVGDYAHASNIAFDEAAVEGQTGRLFADLSTASIGAELRWTPGLGLARAFERTGPYIAARAGGALVMRTSQQLFTEGGLLLLDPKDVLHLTPFAAAALGVEHRFGDHLFLGGELAVSLGVDERILALTAEATWAWY